jgi:hypothetical protein
MQQYSTMCNHSSLSLSFLIALSGIAGAGASAGATLKRKEASNRGPFTKYGIKQKEKKSK